MKDVNKVILLGRLGADPIQRQTKTGVSVIHFPLATSRRFYKEEKEVKDAKEQTEASPSTSPPILIEDPYVEETQWHQIVAWGRQGEACAKHLKKGSAVYIEGFFRSHQYDDKIGITRTSTEVHTEVISFLGSKPAKPIPVTTETPADPF